MVRPFEQRRNKLNFTVSSRMGKSCYCKYIFLLLTPGLIRLCVDYFLIFLIFMHVCEVRYRISVIIVFVSSCIINCHFSTQSSQLCGYNFLENKHMHLIITCIILLYRIPQRPIHQLFSYFAWKQPSSSKITKVNFVFRKPVGSNPLNF